MILLSNVPEQTNTYIKRYDFKKTFFFIWKHFFLSVYVFDDLSKMLLSRSLTFREVLLLVRIFSNSALLPPNRMEMRFSLAFIDIAGRMGATVLALNNRNSRPGWCIRASSIMISASFSSSSSLASLSTPSCW